MASFVDVKVAFGALLAAATMTPAVHAAETTAVSRTAKTTAEEKEAQKKIDVELMEVVNAGTAEAESFLGSIARWTRKEELEYVTVTDGSGHRLTVAITKAKSTKLQALAAASNRFAKAAAPIAGAATRAISMVQLASDFAELDRYTGVGELLRRVRDQECAQRGESRLPSQRQKALKEAIEGDPTVKRDPKNTCL